MALIKRQAYKDDTEPDAHVLDDETEQYEWTSDPAVAVERLQKKGVKAHQMPK